MEEQSLALVVSPREFRYIYSLIVQDEFKMELGTDDQPALQALAAAYVLDCKANMGSSGRSSLAKVVNAAVAITGCGEVGCCTKHTVTIRMPA